MKKFIGWLRESRVWGFGVSVVVMAAVALAFFYPDAFEGNSLRQADMQQGAANGQEGVEYFSRTGEKALWTNSLFSGMPTFQISPSYPSNAFFDWLNDVYGLWLPAPANLLFMMMLGMLILLYVMRMRWYYALLGAIAWGFSSYFVILIGAGHIWKFLALTYIPPTIGGLLLCYRGRLLGGAAMTAVFATLQLNANHPQMTYYFGFVMGAIAIAYLVEAVRGKSVRRWCAATAVALVAGCLAVGANLPSLYHTYEYAKETKRSQSELTSRTDDVADGPAERPTGGLPRQDIVGWSYGKAETFTLLVPNVKGGATARPEAGNMTYMGLDRLPDAAQYADSSAGAILPYLPQYFNDSEGTNGPVYVGAIICALFLLGCIIVRGPFKWALVVMTVLSVLLAWGRNFESLTDFMIYHFPMYSKFRAVESILVIAEFTMPLLGIMALHKVLTTEDAWTRYRRAFFVAFGVPAVFCLLAAFAPGFYGGAVTEVDRQTVSSIQQQVLQMAQAYGYSPAEAQGIVYQYSLSNPENERAIIELRHGLVSADGWRSLLFVVLGAALVALAMRRKLKAAAATLGVAVLVLVDLYGADKRYVSHSSFCSSEVSAADPFAPDAIDRAILADTAQSYRVMDIPGFTSPRRSYHHKMVGGYHAAKLNRYEDLIQRKLMAVQLYGYDPSLRLDTVMAQLAPDEQAVARELLGAYRVLDMLNARYIITGDEDAPVIVNSYAQGNAWLVDSVAFVEGADAEMAAIGNVDLRRRAVADSRFADSLGGGGRVAHSAGDTIFLTHYSPNTLTYHAETREGGIAVFSEVYFPWGWKVSVDGRPASLARANYVLRAMALPAGAHTVTMTFDPDSLRVTGAVAYVCIALMYLLVIAAVALRLRNGMSSKS